MNHKSDKGGITPFNPLSKTLLNVIQILIILDICLIYMYNTKYIKEL